MATPAEGSSQFVVHLEGLKLSPDDEATLAREINATALRELARLDLRADVAFRIPRKEWLGIWLYRLDKGQIPMPKSPLQR